MARRILGATGELADLDLKVLDAVASAKERV
jgi:hypothetical protein